MNKRFLQLSMAAVLALIVSCASDGDKKAEVTVSTASTEGLATFESEMKDAKSRDVDSLSPDHFAKAADRLADAQKISEKGGNQNELMRTVAEGREELQKANQFAMTARTILADVVKARVDAEEALGEAEKAQAMGLADVKSDFVDALKDMKKLSRKIEDNDAKGAEADKADVIKQFRVVETKAMKKATLDTARRLIEESINLSAKKYAPQSLAVAEQQYSAADKFISGNAQNRAEAREKGQQALFYAKRLMHMTKAGRQFAEKRPEEISLWVEREIAGVASQFNADHRDKPFSDQVTEINGSINELKKASRGLASEKSKLAGEKQQLSEEAERLNAEKATLSGELEKTKPMMELDKKYAETREIFTDDEAEVIRNGKTTVIRLRTIKFPVGKAVLLKDNYPLLSKVQKAIKLYGEPKVMVEGHTDSTGSQALNQKLSLERANAVKEYLVANNTIPREKVSEAGFGFSRPLTSDKSPEGRAINRRIDVIIDPAG